MAFRRNFGKDVDERLVGSDQERCALDTHDLLAVHVLFLHHAKLIADFLVYISKECIRKVVLRAELGLGLGRVARDAQYHGAGGLQLLEGVAETAGLNGAARGIGSRIKEKNHGFAFKVREAYFFLFVGFKRKIGDFGIEFHGDFPRMSNQLTISLHYGRAGRGASLPVRIFAARILALATGLLVAVSASAQYPGQIKTDKEKDKDQASLRAVAVLEWTGDLSKPKTSRLVPITVFDGEQLQDGGVYLARPAPLAVDAGVEYMLQKNGTKLGLFDVQNAGQEQGLWVGFGTWKPIPVARPKPMPVMDKVDEETSDKPTLHRKHPSNTSSGGGDSGSSSGGSGPAPDPDRPTLHKKTSDDDSGSTDSGSTSGSSPAADPDRPTLHKAPDASQTSSTGSGNSSGTASDPDRPQLKRGKQKQAADEGYVESLNTTDPDRPRLMRGKSTGGGAEVTPTLLGLPSDMEQAVAVSDPKNRPEHPWEYSWADPADEVKMKAALEDAARAALGIQPKPAPAAKRTTTARAKTKLASPAPPSPLADEQIRVFELAYGSGATLVLTAHTDGAPGQQKYVTLIAQPDLYGSLLVLFKSVTDGAHLDDTPRMRLVDAVDALADNRGELLFELRGQTQRQFALYRVLRGTAKELFVTGGSATEPEARN